MLRSISIKNFRCFDELRIEPLSRINLITGMNSTGKTSLLEALMVLLLHPDPGACHSLPREFRTEVSGANPQDVFWSWLFLEKNTCKPIEMTCDFADGRNHFVRVFDETQTKATMETPKTALFSGPGNLKYFVGPLITQATFPKAANLSNQPRDPHKEALLFNQIILKKQKSRLIQLLQPVEPRLTDLESLNMAVQLSNTTTPLIFADVGLKEFIPATHLGQAFSKLLGIYTQLLASSAKVILIDEFENGLHHSVLSEVWRGLFSVCRELDLQLFATTHSRENIVAANTASQESGGDDFNLIRLDRVGKQVVPTILQPDSIDTFEEMHWEMR